ncbi:MAG TPA: MFS transporter [Marmoricola sp.]|nr:MFS transporter [Marmoricola sp.]
MSRVLRLPVDAVAPPRLGTPFRWLLLSSVVTNLGDGVLLAAGPLLVASETRDPLLVAAAMFLQQLPWLLFGVLAGAWSDRLDRRRVVLVVDLLRACVLAVLTLTILTGVADIRLVLATLFVLGTAETLSDIASSALLVETVERSHLGVANARLQGGFITANQLVGPPVGAALFALARPFPFALTAVCAAAGAVLVSRVALRARPAPDRSRALREDVAEGMRWLWSHPPVRTLTLTIVLFNVTFGAAWSVLVLYAQERLGLDATGYGWLLVSMAVGGLVGTAAYAWLERNVGMVWLMRIGLVLETLTHLALAVTTEALLALAIMFVFGLHAFVWGTTSRTIRQRSVPVELQGRVGSVYMIGVYGGMLVGAPVGGLLAREWGLTAPFWFGFVGSAVLVVVMWRGFAHLTDDAPAARC